MAVLAAPFKERVYVLASNLTRSLMGSVRTVLFGTASQDFFGREVGQHSLLLPLWYCVLV